MQFIFIIINIFTVEAKPTVFENKTEPAEAIASGFGSGVWAEQSQQTG